MFKWVVLVSHNIIGIISAMEAHCDPQRIVGIPQLRL